MERSSGRLVLLYVSPLSNRKCHRWPFSAAGAAEAVAAGASQFQRLLISPFSVAFIDRCHRISSPFQVELLRACMQKDLSEQS